MDMVTFAVLLPFSGRYVPPLWAVSLMGLQWPLGCSHLIINARCGNRAQNRNNLVKAAQREGAKYVLFLDDDTHPPGDAVKKLHYALETADKSVVACGAVYTSKEIPSEPLMYKEEDAGPYWDWRYGDVFPVQGIGTGCLMIKTEVFDRIPEPWFRDIDALEQVGDDPALADLPARLNEFRMTDDLYFCRKVQQAGLNILAHGGVLCVHWDQQGNPHTLPRDSYPMQGVDPWYSGFGIIKANLINPGRELGSVNGGIVLPEGFLSQAEADTLLELARGKRVLEMGAFQGRSTVAMAQTAAEVVSVDWHGGDIHVTPEKFGASSLEAYRRNIAPWPNVTPIVGRFEDEIPRLMQAGNTFDLVFVDGQHDKESVMRDVEWALAFQPAVLAVHDWGAFEVKEGIDALGLTPSRVVDTLAIFERAAA